jgi:hypothetical protein
MKGVELKIKIKKLKPNPYRQIECYPLDELRLSALKISIENTGFWDNILCRKHGVYYEIAYGHHRLEALRQLYGDDYEIDIPCKKISDADMVKIMADENITIYEHDPKVIVETVRVAKEFLENNTGEIKKLVTGIAASDFGSLENVLSRVKRDGVRREILCAFLGANWKEHKIKAALRILDQENPTIAQETPTITHASVVADTRLKPKEQKQIVKKIKEGKRGEDGKVRPLTVDETKIAVATKIAEKKVDGHPAEVKQIIITTAEINALISTCQRFRRSIADEKIRLIKPTMFDAVLINRLTSELFKTGECIAQILGGLRDVKEIEMVG